MEQTIKNKILSLDDLIERVNGLKNDGKTIVQSHGVFDLIHPGIITHLSSAKKQGDVLIVTVIKDKDVRKGPGRPIFPEKLRAENVASLEQVDYVCLVDDDIPFECVRKIKPDIFAKGKAYKERDRIIHEKIFQEEKVFYLEKCRIHETEGFSFSSSQIINSFLDTYPEETKIFLRDFSARYSFDYISKKINELKDLKVLVIGDGIIDEYHYCETMGKSHKSQVIVNKYLNHEVFAGGAFAIANHIAGLCNEVKLITLLGRDDTREDFIRNSLKPNICLKPFYRNDGPTIVKKRYINDYNNQKLFEVNFINDNFVNSECESSIIDYLKLEIAGFDLVLVSDFGHGLITDKIIKTIEELSKKFAVNTQTNGANAGYNLITKYRNPSFICLDNPEARLATQLKYANARDVGKRLLQVTHADYLMITLGSEGSMCFTKEGDINHTPAFASKVVDIIGAGDAFFSFAAPCFALGMPIELFSFVGNAAGALAVQIVGNKKPVEKYEILEFIHTILK
ncbi:MAG: adenylyltransferase/cytidyltransferase family protein [Planctomycetes bacterium]|uniref:PfkB family carbohydrate kinase n=1 Tax=Candidatus Wunengus sp. YC65 TaxID=3367701 RepID=UPI001DA5805E|nr:adenylyltransferase/cytidyltransferase family protein [Planctomycetota bacterium]